MEFATEHLVANEFIRYNNWANQRLLEACQELTPDQLAATAVGTYGTLYDTLVHIVRGEASYALRLIGKAPEPPFNWDDRPKVSAIRMYAGRVGDALSEAMSQVEPGDIIRQQWQGQTEVYKAIVLMIQIVNHGVEHRAHISIVLSQLGVTPPEVDGWSYWWTNMDRLGEDSSPAS